MFLFQRRFFIYIVRIERYCFIQTFLLFVTSYKNKKNVCSIVKSKIISSENLQQFYSYLQISHKTALTILIKISANFCVFDIFEKNLLSVHISYFCCCFISFKMRFVYLQISVQRQSSSQHLLSTYVVFIKLKYVFYFI